MSRNLTVQIRVTEQEKEGLEAAAEIAGISLSAWTRQRLRMSASQELAQVGKKAPFLKTIKIEKNEQ